MSRNEFSAKYRPFNTSWSESSQTSLRKGGSPQDGRFSTRPFSTYRDGATMNRLSIDKIKREISRFAHDVKRDAGTRQHDEIRAMRKIPKARLYELREKPKVSLIKKVSLEKRYKQEGTPVSPIKRVTLEKRFMQQKVEQQGMQKISLIKEQSRQIRHPGPAQNRSGEITQQLFFRDSIKRKTLEKKLMVTRPTEKPVRFTEKIFKPKEYTIFEPEQRNQVRQIANQQTEASATTVLKAELQQKKIRVRFAEINKSLVVTPDQFASVISQTKYFTKELQYTKEEVNKTSTFETGITPPKVEQIIFHLKNKQKENIFEKKEKVKNEDDDPRNICFWKDLMKIAAKQNFVENINQNVQGKIWKKGKAEGKIPGMVSNSINGEVILASANIKEKVCPTCTNFLTMNKLKLAIAQEPAQ